MAPIPAERVIGFADLPLPGAPDGEDGEAVVPDHPGGRVLVAEDNALNREICEAMLSALGCEVEELYCRYDGTFPNHHPDPTMPENLVQLQDAVTGQGLDMGIAFDGGPPFRV